jgi:hypothetical protein
MCGSGSSRPVSYASLGSRPAADERVELHLRLDEGRQLAGRRDESPGLPCGAQRIRVAGAEVDGVDLGQLVPRQRIGAVRMQLVAHQRDRALAVLIEVRERAALRLVADRGMDAAAELFQRRPGLLSELVVPDRHEEVDVGSEAHELSGGDRASAGGLLPGVGGGDDLARRGHSLDLCEADPFDVADDRCPHNFDPLRVRQDDGSRARPTIRIFL